MSEESLKFDSEADDLHRRQGRSEVDWNFAKVDSANVPAGLKHLLPIAIRWSAISDRYRYSAESPAPEQERSELREQLKGTHSIYEDWTFGALTEFDPKSAECWLFGVMYGFEFEECNGPGINMKLGWAIRRFQDSPDETNRQLLQTSLDGVIARGRRFIKPRQAWVEVAENLLLQASKNSG